MNKLTRKVKSNLFDFLKNQPNSFGENVNGIELIEFLNDIWNLRELPSEDDRFNDAYGDIIQHTINNNDWDVDYLFIERLKLLEEDAVFIKFIETIVSPKYKENENEVVKFVLLIDPYLEKNGLKLAVAEFSEDGIPIYRIKDYSDADNHPDDLPENKLPFFVINNNKERADNSVSLKIPKVTPSFILSFNSGWNDFDIYSEFFLFYYSSNNPPIKIGSVKIISNGDEKNTFTKLDKEFTKLNNTFCSMGQSIEYYYTLKKILGNKFESVLYAIKDAAFFPEINDLFQSNEKFKNSVLRYDSVERILREAKYKLYEYDLTNLYKFQYIFKPLYSDNSIDLDFQFDNKKLLSNRIYALIGKNGTGKTQLITSLPVNISKKQKDFFNPKIPLFSKVIAVSYSMFDQFEIPKKTSSFNYVYCGLRQKDNTEISEKGLVLRFHSSWKKLKDQERIDQWRSILSNFLEEEVLNLFVIPNKDFVPKKNNYEVDINGFHKAKNILSSGQSIILYIVTEIIANIRLDSLLLFDEPETHLHPNAITQLMNTIYELVNEFESYCIIATHSPIIIQEVFSKNVYILERNENIQSIRKIGIESFGENISTLTDEVFGNRQVPKHYKKIIDNLAFIGYSFDEIVSMLETDDIKLSLNARLYISGITNK